MKTGRWSAGQAEEASEKQPSPRLGLGCPACRRWDSSPVSSEPLAGGLVWHTLSLLWVQHSQPSAPPPPLQAAEGSGLAP